MSLCVCVCVCVCARCPAGAPGRSPRDGAGRRRRHSGPRARSRRGRGRERSRPSGHIVGPDYFKPEYRELMTEPVIVAAAQSQPVPERRGGRGDIIVQCSQVKGWRWRGPSNGSRQWPQVNPVSVQTSLVQKTSHVPGEGWITVLTDIAVLKSQLRLCRIISQLVLW